MIVNTDLNQINNISFQLDGQVKNAQASGKESMFEQFYNAALDVVNETNLYQLQADQLQRDFAVGKTDNMLSVIMAQEQAATTLNFTVQVTNKVIEAYREIMRIQM